MVLLQHGANGPVGSIRLDGECPGEIGHREHGSCTQSPLQLHESILLQLPPCEWYPLAGQVRQWCGDLSEMCDESVVVVGKAKELLNLPLRARGWPIPDSGNLGLVHPHPTLADRMSQVRNLTLSERTLTLFREEFVFSEASQYPT